MINFGNKAKAKAKANVKITREMMPKNDELFHTIKYGVQPKFRLERIVMDDGPNEYADTHFYIKYVITNNPKREV